MSWFEKEWRRDVVWTLPKAQAGWTLCGLVMFQYLSSWGQMRLCARHSATRDDGATQSNHRTFKFISRPKTSTSRHIYTELHSKDIKPQCDFARSVRG